MIAIILKITIITIETNKGKQTHINLKPFLASVYLQEMLYKTFIFSMLRTPL